MIVTYCLATIEFLFASLFSFYKFFNTEFFWTLGNLEYWINHCWSCPHTHYFDQHFDTVRVHGSILLLTAILNLTVDFIDLHWVIIALFMRVNLWWKMELSCIRMRNWVGEGLADLWFLPFEGTHISYIFEDWLRKMARSLHLEK